VFASHAELSEATPPSGSGSAILTGQAPRSGEWWGPFQVEAELGRGANARVYRVRVPGQHASFALKVLTNPRDRARLRFEREARLVGSLRHPGIVALHGAGTVGERPFLLYALVPGASSLSGYWSSLSTRQRVDLVSRVANAVGHAHAHGVLHRDLKPDNVLVDADGDPRVVDFGLATHTEAEALTRTGSWVGTPSYMAPEQFQAERALQTPAVDVWSLGVLLYEALTERLPFHGTSVMELVVQIAETAVKPPRKLNREVTPAVEAVCLRALEKDPALRYPDARAFAQALRAALSAPPAERPLGRWVALSAVAAALAVGATVLVVALRGERAPVSATPVADSPFTGLDALTALERWGPDTTRRRAEERLAVAPEDLEARLALASSLARLELWGDAVREARAVLDRRPQDLVAIEILAVASHGVGDPAAAQEYCDRGLRLDPSRPKLWDIQVVLCAYHGDLDGALRAATRALELAPGESETLANYALVLDLHGRREEALDYYEQALRADNAHDPDFVYTTRYNRGLSLMRLERYDEVLEDALFLTRERPGESSGYCLRAMALLERDPEAALVLAEQLTTDFPEDAQAYQVAGEVFRKLKRYEAARHAFERSLELEPRGNLASICRRSLEKMRGK